MLHFKFDEGLDNLDIYLMKGVKVDDLLIPEGTLLGHTDKPRLTWDPGRINSDNDLYKVIINQLFGAGRVIIEYDNLPIAWLTPGLFPPSIDSLFFMKTFKDKGYLDRNFQSIIDVGTGTGVNGLYLAKNNANIKSALLIDYQDASKDVLINTKLNGLEGKIRFIQGDGLIKELPFVDLIIANPPYIPETTEMESARGSKVNPYQGVSLIKHVIDNYDKFSDRLLMQVSSVCDKELEEFNQNHTVEVINSMRVPARFTFLSKEHRAYLVESDRLRVNNPEEFIQYATDNNGEWPFQELKVLRYY